MTFRVRAVVNFWNPEVEKRIVCSLPAFGRVNSHRGRCDSGLRPDFVALPWIPAESQCGHCDSGLRPDFFGSNHTVISVDNHSVETVISL